MCYFDSALSIHIKDKWFADLKGARTYAYDAPRSVRPKEVVTQKNIRKYTTSYWQTVKIKETSWFYNAGALIHEKAVFKINVRNEQRKQPRVND